MPQYCYKIVTLSPEVTLSWHALGALMLNYGHCNLNASDFKVKDPFKSDQERLETCDGF